MHCLYHAIHIDEYTKHLPEGMWGSCCDSAKGWTEIGMAFNEHLASLHVKYNKLITDAFFMLPIVFAKKFFDCLLSTLEFQDEISDG